ncbi:hypothetical protein CEXT_242131 [Caerostris extrusa]|uniref:Uncharacterized protein n=1 Tax=Caerostris extrusa TaxID=172846 RepID=A0AAV4X486_CAEEX|nr:hypothetical protein CEXT_242131 [Caerostris extrusa]
MSFNRIPTPSASDIFSLSLTLSGEEVESREEGAVSAPTKRVKVNDLLLHQPHWSPWQRDIPDGEKLNPVKGLLSLSLSLCVDVCEKFQLELAKVSLGGTASSSSAAMFGEGSFVANGLLKDVIAQSWRCRDDR